MSGKASREKGKRGEREAAKFLRGHGYGEARRGQQYSGASGNADVTGLPGVHLEVKRTEALRLYDALDQARRDATHGEVPVVLHRKNNCRWVVVLDAEDWMMMFREWDAGKVLGTETETTTPGPSGAGAGETRE